MTWQSVTLVAEHSKSRLGARLVMLTLANHDAEAGCFVSIDRIAKEANLSARQVLRCLSDLEAMGELGIDRGAGPNGTNRYTFLLPRRLPLTTDDRMSRDTLSMDNGGPAMSPEQKQQTIGVPSSEVPSASSVPSFKSADAPEAKIRDPLAEQLLSSDSTAQYLISRMSEAWRRALSPAVLIRLGRRYGVAPVLDALRNVRQDEPAPERAFPYLEAICKRLAEGAA